MPKFKNVSPQGALELPLLGRVVAAGEVIEVTPAQAKGLRGQDAIWRPVKGAGGDDTDQAPNAPQIGGGAAQSSTGEGEGA